MAVLTPADGEVKPADASASDGDGGAASGCVKVALIAQMKEDVSSQRDVRAESDETLRPNPHPSPTPTPTPDPHPHPNPNQVAAAVLTGQAMLEAMRRAVRPG